MATSRFADKKRGPAVPQKEPVPDSAIVPELLVKVELGIMTKDVAKELVQKVIDAEKKLFTDEVFADLTRFSQAMSLFNQYKASVYSIGKGCFILGLLFLQIDDVDTFYHEHYKLGPGTLSDKLTGILISDSLRNKVNGANLIVRLQVKQEDYLRVRRRLEKGIRRTTSVDSLVTVLLPPKKTDSHPLLNSLDLATTPSTQDSSFTHWVSNPCTKQLVLKMRKTSQALTGVEAKQEIAKHRAELQEDMVRSLQRELTRLTQEQETAQKVLLDKNKEIEELIINITGANKGMGDTIRELLAEKTKLTNKLAMMEERQFPRRRSAGSMASASVGKRGRSPEVVAGSSKMMRGLSLSEQDVMSVLLVIDAYGPSYGLSTESAFNRQVAQFLQRHGATVHSTALQATEEDKRCAMEDGVILHLPVQDPHDERMPSLDWLTFDHISRYPDIPQDLKCILGHSGITSHAAKRIQEYRCQHAKLVLFNHDIPEDTEYYRGTQKVMAMGRKMEGILEDAMNADAVFSLGRRIYNYFESEYRSLVESKPRQHFLFLPRPSPVFEAISVRPGRGQEKVVLSVGRVTEVDKLKGHDLTARALGEVAEKITNVSLHVRGIDENDYEASKRILEENLHSGKIKPTLLPCGTQEDIAQDMKKAHLVLMPSRAEPFGLIGLEAIAAGIPVLISDKSGLADMIKDLIKEKKCPADIRHRIVKTSVRESDLGEDAREWAKRIVDTLEFSESEFDRAAEYKKHLLESRYWEESHQNLLRVCGLTD